MAMQTTLDVRSRVVEVRKVRFGDVAAHPHNFRRHPKNQRAALEGVVSEVGFASIPQAYYSEENGGALTWLDGHLRSETFPDYEGDVAILDVDDKEAALLLATLDPIAALATHDAEALDALLRDVQTGDAAVQAMLSQMAEDAGLYQDKIAVDAEPQIDKAEELRQKWGVETGQMWRLGDHRIICGDCTDAAVVERVMGGGKINIAFTSPPYAEQREYDVSSGFRPIPPHEYVDWFAPVTANVAKHLAHDGSWFVNIKPSADGLDTSLHVFDLVIAHARDWGWHFVTEFCWERVGVPKSVTFRFKNQFEPIYQFTRGNFKFRPDAVRHQSDSVIRPKGKGTGSTSWKNKQDGNGGFFSASNVRKTNIRGGEGGVMQGNYATVDRIIEPGLAYPGNRLPTFIESHTALGHAAAFPIGLPGFFIQAYTDSGDVVYEPFSGSGSTLMAAQQHDRKCSAVEISPGYVAVAIERWTTATGGTPELIG